MATKEFVPATSAVVVQVATLELRVFAEQPERDVPPSSKLTVPVAPEVTVAVNVIDVPGFCGDAGEAVNAVVDGEPDALWGIVPISVEIARAIVSTTLLRRENDLKLFNGVTSCQQNDRTR